MGHLWTSWLLVERREIRAPLCVGKRPRLRHRITPRSGAVVVELALTSDLPLKEERSLMGVQHYITKKQDAVQCQHSRGVLPLCNLLIKR